MYRIAIVEDEANASEQLRLFFDRYAAENAVSFDIKRFQNGVLFLEEYKADFDVVFMDIEMPLMDGMAAAHRLRERDEYVLLVFVTNLAKYVFEGYEVNATNYIIKPLHYQDFKLKLKKIISILDARRDADIAIPIANGAYRVRTFDIEYVEVIGHTLAFHLMDGRTVETRGSLSNLEKKLEPYGFFRCNSCYLVNVKHIVYVKNFDLQMKSRKLEISRAKRKHFLEGIIQCAGGGK